MAVHETVTPSGIAIQFEDGEPDGDGKRKRRAYWVEGDKHPSVTTVTGQFDKPGLQWAAEKLTVEGCIALAQEGELPSFAPAALSALHARELRFRQLWDKKAERGTEAHAELLRYAIGEDQPDLEDVPADQRAFVRGVAAFQVDHEPEALHSELFVASSKFGFAGRLDLICRLKGRDGVGLVDLKTTEEIPRYKDGTPKAPYLENILQVSGYHLAAVECGYPKTDWAAVLRVEASGGYVLTEVPIQHSAFLRALASYNVNRKLEAQARAMAKGKVPA